VRGEGGREGAGGYEPWETTNLGQWQRALPVFEIENFELNLSLANEIVRHGGFIPKLHRKREREEGGEEREEGGERGEERGERREERGERRERELES
jgi:hypothetical protein